jgi:hypothetical protein
MRGIRAEPSNVSRIKPRLHSSRCKSRFSSVVSLQKRTRKSFKVKLVWCPYCYLLCSYLNAKSLNASPKSSSEVGFFFKLVYIHNFTQQKLCIKYQLCILTTKTLPAKQDLLLERLPSWKRHYEELFWHNCWCYLNPTTNPVNDMNWHICPIVPIRLIRLLSCILHPNVPYIIILLSNARRFFTIG